MPWLSCGSLCSRWHERVFIIPIDGLKTSMLTCWCVRYNSSVLSFSIPTLTSHKMFLLLQKGYIVKILVVVLLRCWGCITMSESRPGYVVNGEESCMYLNMYDCSNIGRNNAYTCPVNKKGKISKALWWSWRMFLVVIALQINNVTCVGLSQW